MPKPITKFNGWCGHWNDALTPKHGQVLGEGRLSELHQMEHAHRVLFVFETESALQAATARLLEDPQLTPAMRQQFAFSTLARLQVDFTFGWHFLVPGRRTIFDMGV